MESTDSLTKFERNGYRVIRADWMSDDFWRREKHRCGKLYNQKTMFYYGKRVVDMHTYIQPLLRE